MSAGSDNALIGNGYEPVALIGKRPPAKNWNIRENTAEALAAERSAHPNATNTGIRTGRLVAIDIDLADTDHAAKIETVVTDTLGATLLRRVGSKGCILCYYNSNPIPKITISADGKRQIEILGIGQQFAAYGIHPDTGKPWEWTNECLGGDPLQTTLADLSPVSPEMLREAAKKIAETLGKLGYSNIKISGAGLANENTATAASAASGRPVTPATIEAMLRCIPPSCDRHEWLTVCGGLVNAPVTDPNWNGLDVFTRWSRGELHGGIMPDNFKDDEDCADQWRRDQEKRGMP